MDKRAKIEERDAKPQACSPARPRLADEPPILDAEELPGTPRRAKSRSNKPA